MHNEVEVTGMQLPFHATQEFYWRKTVQESPWRSTQILTLACFSGMHLLWLTWLHRTHPSLTWPAVILDFLLLTSCWVRVSGLRRRAAMALKQAMSRMEEQGILRTTYSGYQVCFLIVAVTAIVLQLIEACVRS